MASCCAKYGKGIGPVWLSDLSCTGREQSLLECSHNGWGNNSCDHAQDAGVICHSPPTEKPSSQPDVTTPTTASTMIEITPTLNASNTLAKMSPFTVTTIRMFQKTPGLSNSYTVELPSFSPSSRLTITTATVIRTTPAPNGSIITRTKISPSLSPSGSSVLSSHTTLGPTSPPGKITAVYLFNPLRPSVKLQILLFCFHTFLTEVVGRSC